MEDVDQRIALGDAFIQKYPNSKYAGSVYSGLSLAEYNKQDFTKMFANSEKALALNPDDIQMLVIVGWVIPHTYKPDEPNADAQLDKAVESIPESRVLYSNARKIVAERDAGSAPPTQR